MKKTLFYGFVVWLIPFIVSVCTFPLKTSQPQLFESIMPVVLVATVVACSVRSELSGLPVDLVWMVVSWLFDAMMFSAGPMRMSFASYMMDIGLGYCIIPIITAGYGCAGKRAAMVATVTP